MAQTGWKFTSSEGKAYYVGLFHGEESGHLLIYCGPNIMHMDFSVLQGGTYTFLIDDDLCEVVIEPAHSGFSYQFFANREKEAERKELRQKTDSKYRRQTIYFAIGFFVVIFCLSIVMVVRYGKLKEAQRKALSPIGFKEKTVAKVELETAYGDTLVVRYRFLVRDKAYSNVLLLPSGKTPFGLPIEQGDEFTVFYAEGQPFSNSLKWSMPSEAQVARYREKITALHHTLNPELTKQRAACEVNVAFEIKGLEGLADFYYQRTPPEENPEHNDLTYKRLVRDVPFQQAAQKACL